MITTLRGRGRPRGVRREDRGGPRTTTIPATTPFVVPREVINNIVPFTGGDSRDAWNAFVGALGPGKGLTLDYAEVEAVYQRAGITGTPLQRLVLTWIPTKLLYAHWKYLASWRERDNRYDSRLEVLELLYFWLMGVTPR